MNRKLVFCVAAFALSLLALVGLGNTAQAALHDPTANSFPQATGEMTTGPHPVQNPAPPQQPNVVLYDQYDNIGFNATNSQQYEPSMLPYDDFCADDFVVPTGQTWTLNEVDVAGYIYGNGPVHNFNVSIYTDAGLPGTEIYAATNMAFTNPVAGEFAITLSPSVALGPGAYWVMVQGNICWFCNEGQWSWYNRSAQSNHVAGWYNPGDAWGTACNDAWGIRWTCQGDRPSPDQVFRLVGSVVGPTDTPVPTATWTPTNTPTNTPTITLTPTNTATPQALLIGHTNWQGRGTQPNALQVQPLTLTLKSGATRVDFPGYQVTDASGFFTVSLGTLPPGTYTWRVKGPSYLSTSGLVTLSGVTTQVEMGLQRAGDLDSDNVCNIDDFNLVKSNFGLGGSPPIGPAGPAKRSIGLDLANAGISQPTLNGEGRVGKQNPQSPVSFLLDDGSTETSFGLNMNYHGFPVLAINRFTPNPSDFPMVLNQITIQFPDPVMAYLDLTGRNIDLLVYEDPSGSGDPTNANKIYQQTVQVQVADGVTFSSYPVNIPLSGPGDVYIGFSNTYDHSGTVPYSYPMPIDRNSLQRRSWVAANTNGADPDYNDLANNLMLTLIDNVGQFLAGNWVIRGTADTVGGLTATFTVTPTRTSTFTRTPVPTRTNTPTSTPQAWLVGHVIWQGHGTQPNLLQVQPLTLTLKSAITQFDFPGYQVTDASGFFTVSVNTLPPGTYNWRVKGPAYLSTSGTVALSGANTQMEMGLQQAGDLNGDNVCNTQDFTLIKGNFGQGGALTPSP